MHACTGACIHRAERNFELILSSNLLDLEKASELFNSPLSMCAEGHFSESRSHIAHRLVKAGHKVGRGVEAASKRFVSMICKPTSTNESWWWMDPKLRNAPVHPDDKRLVEWMIANGDGVEDNEHLVASMTAHARVDHPSTNQAEPQHPDTFADTFAFHQRATVFSIPTEPDVQAWSMETLRHLDLSCRSTDTGCLTTMPDAFYQLVNLESANLSDNSLWEISPNIKAMGSLKVLKVHNNCLDALPDELEQLPKLDEFSCHGNRITYPPQSVIVRGLDAIKSFFLGIREHGRSTNTDMKVLVVGLSEAGKTSLINAVLTGNSHLVRRGDRTVGIEQKTWSFSRLDAAAASGIAGQSYRTIARGFNANRYFGFRAQSVRFEFSFATDTTGTVGIAILDDRRQNIDDAPATEFVLQDGQFGGGDPLTFVGDVDFESGNGPAASRPRGCRGLMRFTLVFSADFEQIVTATATTVVDPDAGADPQAPPVVNVFDLADTQQIARLHPKLAPDMNLLLFDFAGQQEYYATHHLFLTKRALYVLAFDVSKFSSATFADQVQFWVDAISDRVPGAKLIVCGTHADKLDAANARRLCDKVATTLKNKQARAVKQLKKKCKAAKDRLKEIGDVRKTVAIGIVSRITQSDAKLLEELLARRSKDELKLAEWCEADTALLKLLDEAMERDDNGLTTSQKAESATLHAQVQRWTMAQHHRLQLPDKIWPVSSGASLSNIPELSQQIKDAVLDKSAFPEVDEEIPLFYSQVRRTVRALRNEPQYYFMERGAYLDLVATKLSLSRDEVDQATMFLHSLGEIFCFNAPAGTAGMDVVFLKVEHAVDAMKFLVRHDHPDATTYRGNVDEDKLGLSPHDFQQFKSDLLDRGLLDVALLDRLWHPLPPEGLGITRASNPEKFYTLVKLLVQFEIIAIADRDAEGRPIMFYVPEFSPTNLPPGAWNPSCPDGTLEVHRWFQFAGVPPRGLVQRLQIKLCSMHNGDSQAHIAKDGGSLLLWNCPVFTRVHQGSNPDAPSAYGLQVVVRGVAAADGVWKTVKTIHKLIEHTFEEWPGLTFGEHCVHAGTYVDLLGLQNELRAGLTQSAVLPGNPDLQLLLGPTNAEAWEGAPAETVKQPAVMEAASLDAQATNAVHDYRDRGLPWVMIAHGPDTHEQAVVLFQQLCARGVPAWAPGFAGAHGVASDVLQDGIQNAAVVVPIMSEGFREDAFCMQVLAEAEKRNKPVVCAGEDVVATVPELVDIAVSNGLRLMGEPVLVTSKPRRERRKSFSQDAETATDPNWLSLEALFAEELNLDTEAADNYARRLREHFLEHYASTSDDTLLLYDADQLETAGIESGVHRQQILLWVQQAVANRHRNPQGQDLRTVSGSRDSPRDV